MGVISSIPLCSRGGDNGDSDNTDSENKPDVNNNEPMPSLQPAENVVICSQPNSVANQNVALDDQPLPSSSRRSAASSKRPYSSSLESDDDDGGGDHDSRPPSSIHEASGEQTSDSGLEQSSSDELELGAAALGDRRPATGRWPLPLEEPAARPFSAAAGDVDEGINYEGHSQYITIPLENHDTCDDDDDDDDEADEDPLERPPEPTVPDERVDSTSSSEGSRSRQDSPVKEDIRTMNRTRAQDLPMSGRRRTGAGDTASAISNLLSEIVGDRPYCQEEKHQPQMFGGAVESEGRLTRGEGVMR